MLASVLEAGSRTANDLTASGVRAAEFRRFRGGSVPCGTGGRAKTSYVVCHQVSTLDRAKLTKRLGNLPSESLREIEEWLKIAMDID